MGISPITIYDFAILITVYLDTIESELQHRLLYNVYANDGEHWRLKTQISWLKDIISTYVATFNDSKLFRLQLEPYKITKSGLVWAIK